MKANFAGFQCPEFGSAGVAAPTSPMAPPLASGEIIRKGTVVVMAFSLLSISGWAYASAVINRPRTRSAKRFNFIFWVEDKVVTRFSQVSYTRTSKSRKPGKGARWVSFRLPELRFLFPMPNRGEENNQIAGCVPPYQDR